MDKNKKRNVLNIIIICALVLFNIIVTIQLFRINKRTNQYSKIRSSVIGNKTSHDIFFSEYYNSPCPDFELNDYKGNKLQLSELAGNVIVLRFTRFQEMDIGYLIYLDQIYNKYKEKGIHILFIHTITLSGPNNKVTEGSFLSPIYDDDGYISGLFRARLLETIIIGRDFRIKYRDNESSNTTIYRKISESLFDNGIPEEDDYTRNDLSIFNNFFFNNVENGKEERISNLLMSNNIALLCFISTCLECPEAHAIKSIKMELEKERRMKNKYIILFGYGNNAESILRFSRDNDLLSDFTVGIIKKADELQSDKYFKLFSFKDDPTLYIIKNNKIVYRGGKEEEEKYGYFIKKYLL